MKRKFKRAIASLMVAMTLSVGIGSMNVNAANWAVRDIKGAPGSINVHEYYDAKVASSNVTYTSETCTLATYCISSTGQTSRARYYGYYEYTSNGTLYKMSTFTSRYHTTQTISQNIPFINTVPKGHTYYTGYILEHYDAGNCNYSGTIG